MRNLPGSQMARWVCKGSYVVVAIVAKLDAELNRSWEIRRILDRISSISPLDSLLMELNQLKQGMVPIVLPPESISQPGGSTGLRTVAASKSRQRTKSSENRALTCTIPATPVVVYAAQVASERQRRAPARSAMTDKGREFFLAKPRAEAVPGVEALRNRWLAQG